MVGLNIMNEKGSNIKYKIKMNRIYSIDEGEFDSFDSYYKNVQLTDFDLVIPYINLAVSNHELNQSDSPLKYIDRCYVILCDISYLKIYNKNTPLINRNINLNQIELFFGGSNIGSNDFIDMHVKCSYGYLRLLKDSTLSSNLWIPINTPNFKQNISEKLLDNFFSVSNIMSVYKECISIHNS